MESHSAAALTVDLLLRGSLGNLFAVGYSNGVVRLYSAEEPKCLAEIQAHSRQVNALICHPSKPLILTAGDDTFVNVWEISKTQEFDVSLKMSSRCSDMQVVGLALGGEQLSSIVAAVYDYKSMLVWDNVI